MGWSGGELGATIERVRIGTTVSLHHGAYIREGGNAASAFECRLKTRRPTQNFCSDQTRHPAASASRFASLARGRHVPGGILAPLTGSPITLRAAT
jgi:hypothetical protein